MWDRVFAGKRASPLGMVGSNLQETAFRITRGGEAPKLAPRVIVVLNGYINLRWRGDHPAPMMEWLVRWLKVGGRLVGGQRPRPQRRTGVNGWPAAASPALHAHAACLPPSDGCLIMQAAYPTSKVAVMALLPVNSTWNDAVAATNVQVGAGGGG